MIGMKNEFDDLLHHEGILYYYNYRAMSGIMVRF